MTAAPVSVAEPYRRGLTAHSGLQVISCVRGGGPECTCCDCTGPNSLSLDRPRAIPFCVVDSSSRSVRSERLVKLTMVAQASDLDICPRPSDCLQEKRSCKTSEAKEDDVTLRGILQVYVY